MAKEGTLASSCLHLQQEVTAAEDTNTKTREVAAAESIRYACYEGEHQLPLIMSIIDQELSEPYSIFTYRYFTKNWPRLCFLAFHEDNCVGTIVCKMGQHRNTFRGYIAMLVVIKPYRGKGIATELVTRAIQVMQESGCEEVALEAEVTNKGALALYGNLGFIRVKRLFRYYLNGVDAFRLKLLFPRPDLDSLLMLSEENYNMELSHPISEGSGYHWDQQTNC
jgi:peptide alpha-N-acetyltransferase